MRPKHFAPLQTYVISHFMTDQINYQAYMAQAMQKMIGSILDDVAQNGLPGDHHFYINFRTDFRGVDIPDHLRENFPEEITIVMQDWYEDLAVMDDRFAVTLSFYGKAESLVIPFASITGFSDPSVTFNLRFDAQEDVVIEEAESNETDAHSDEKTSENEEKSQDAEIIQLDQFRSKSKD